MLNDKDEDEILDLLSRIREIAALDDDDASLELSQLVNDIRRGEDWELEDARDTLAAVHNKAQHIANSMQHGIPPEDWWRARDFLREVEELPRRFPRHVRVQLAGDMAETRHIVLPIARKAAVYSMSFMIEDYLTRAFANIQEGDRMLRDLAAAEEQLKTLGEGECNTASLRQARERLVRHRWARRMEDAEVAEAGGNIKKAEKLRAEARVLLKHDWLKVFPRESPPET